MGQHPKSCDVAAAPEFRDRSVGIRELEKASKKKLLLLWPCKMHIWKMPTNRGRKMLNLTLATEKGAPASWH